MTQDMFDEPKEAQEIVLRYYQESGVSGIRASFMQGNRRVMLQQPTGSGKTVTAMHMIKEAIARGKRVAFVVDQINLATQTFEAAEKFGIEYGVIQGKHPKFNIYAPLQVCTIQTLRAKHKDSRNDRLYKHFDLVIIDEAHMIFKAQTAWMDDHRDAFYVGLSATPFTKGLGLVWEDLVLGPTTQTLIDEGHLCDFDAYAPSSPDLSEVKITAGDYNEKALSVAMRKKPIYADITSTWLKLGGNKKTIAFCVDIAHSEEMANEFNELGVRAESIHSKLSDDQKTEITADFEAGKIKVLCSVAMIIKGWDDPSCVVAIDAAPTKSLSRHIQKMGRVLRTHESKSKAIILDHANNLSTLGMPTRGLPTKLDTSVKGERGEALEREEPLPKQCPSCKYMKPPRISTCPSCGFKPERFAEIEILPAEMKKMTANQKKHVKGRSMEELAGWYGFFQSYQHQNNYSQSYAVDQFKKKFGFDPVEKFGSQSVEWGSWTQEQKQWVKSKNIRAQYARGKYGGGKPSRKQSAFDKTVQKHMANI